MGVADEPRFAEPVQGQARPRRRESATEVVSPQGVEYFDLEEMWYMKGFV